MLLKGVTTMTKVRCVSIILVILFVVTPAAYTRDYIEVWPEGWSEITPFFPTSIFADRFFVTSDPVLLQLTRNSGC